MPFARLAPEVVIMTQTMERPSVDGLVAKYLGGVLFNSGEYQDTAHNQPQSHTFEGMDIGFDAALMAIARVEQVESNPAIARANKPLRRLNDQETFDHQRRVAILVAILAKDDGLPEEEIDALIEAALVHDVGKAARKARVATRKPGKWSREDRLDMQTHVRVGVAILRRVGIGNKAIDLTANHHMDLAIDEGRGAGPYGMPNATPESQRASERAHRLFRAADYYDARRNPRVYRDDFLSASATILAMRSEMTTPKSIIELFNRRIRH